MRYLRTASHLVLAFAVSASPAWAQQSTKQPLRDSAAAQAAAAPAQAARRPLFLTGVVLGLAGGTAIILGSTVAKSSDSTSGNTPEGVFDACESLKANPVYRGNECSVLKGPNTALVIGGVIAAATGVTLALIGSPHSSVTFGPGIVRFRHRVTF